LARDLFSDGEFLEIFIDTPLEVPEQRDAKGLYKKARSGELKNFTGIDSPYEQPESPEFSLFSHQFSLDDLVQQTIELLQGRGVL